ncbi:MAG: hypothetical protein RLZZ450_6048 [Pseudomonadota bacterium]|jgi:hypothetical protein
MATAWHYRRVGGGDLENSEEGSDSTQEVWSRVVDQKSDQAATFV